MSARSFLCPQLCRGVSATGFVEIDESKFGKMKYRGGKPVNGQWVFRGIERGTHKCFFQVVEQCSKEEWLGVINEWVLPGNTIMSDCWKAYNCLTDEGFEHLRVNHSVNFKDPDTGAYTNFIEGTWSAVKRSLRSHTSHAKDTLMHSITTSPSICGGGYMEIV